MNISELSFYSILLFDVDIHSDLDLDARCEDPEHELFIFSILLMRPAMSKVFWREGSVSENSSICDCTNFIRLSE